MRFARALAVAALILMGTGAAFAAGPPGFATPEAGVDALLAVVRSNNAAAVGRVLGPGSGRLVSSGDTVADRADRASFAARYDKQHRIERQGGDKAVLLIGADEWPFPIPLRRHGDAWRFDAHAGAVEILDRRIGRNELDTIATCRAIVDAERDYASEDRTGGGFNEYAQHFVSRPGKEDGLYWPAASGTPESPLGPLMAAARAQGYGGRHAPYHGYRYKLMTRQGAAAPGGARDYIVRGHMIGGVALVAYPAIYGDSGVMTFIVNQDGRVYEKNLGRRTSGLAARMTRYDPDPSWRFVRAGDEAASRKN